MFEAAICADARARRPGLKHGAHALGDVPGVHGVRHIISGTAPSKRWPRTSFLPMLVRTSSRPMVAFESARRVYIRHREVGFVAELRGHAESRQFIPIFVDSLRSSPGCEWVVSEFDIIKGW